MIDLPTSLLTASWMAAGTTSGDGFLIEAIVSVMGVLGVFGVGGLVAAENIFPPIPSEVILPMAGFAAEKGEFTVVAAVIAATVGSLLGAIVLYWLGAWLGHERFVRLAARIPLVNEADVTRTVAWFRKHGAVSVLFGRMVPVFRSLISIPAGIERMPMGQFLLYTALGSAVWNGVLVGAGYALGSQWERVSAWIETFQWVVLGVFAVLLAIYVIRKVRRGK